MSLPILIAIRLSPHRHRCCSSPKFRLRGSKSYTLKWKQVDGTFQCTLCRLACTSHTPIATYEPQLGRISMYPQSTMKADTTQPLYSGISLQLLQYIIITAMLLSTPLDSWREVVNVPDFSSPSPPSPITIHSPWNTYNIESRERRSSRMTLKTITPFVTPFATTLALPNTSTQKLDLLSSSEVAYVPWSTAVSVSLSPPASPRSSSSSAAGTPTTPYAPEIPMDLDVYSCTPRASISFEAKRRRSMPSLRAERARSESMPIPPPFVLERPPLPARALTERRTMPTRRTLATTDAPPPSYSEIEWTERVPRRRQSHY